MIFRGYKCIQQWSSPFKIWCIFTVWWGRYTISYRCSRKIRNWLQAEGNNNLFKSIFYFIIYIITSVCSVVLNLPKVCNWLFLGLDSGDILYLRPLMINIKKNKLIWVKFGIYMNIDSHFINVRFKIMFQYIFKVKNTNWWYLYVFLLSAYVIYLHCKIQYSFIKINSIFSYNFLF